MSMLYQKKGLKKIGAGAVLLIAMLSSMQAQAANKCGDMKEFTIANMTWLSASVLANITKTVLSEGYGCNATLVPGDTVPTVSSMLTKTKPHIAPELWVGSVEKTWRAIVDKGQYFRANDVFKGRGGEGFYVPDYIAEKYNIKTIEDVKKNWKLFTSVQNPDQGRFFGCPPGWACEIITNNLFTAFEMGENFEYFSPGSGANLKAAIARAVTRKKPILAYYWSPTSVVGRYNLVKIDLGKYNKKNWECLSNRNCKEPKPSGFPVAEVYTAVAVEVKQKAPQVAKGLKNMSYDVTIINQLLAWADDESASAEEVANEFFKTQSVWESWFPADVVANIKKSIK